MTIDRVPEVFRGPPAPARRAVRIRPGLLDSRQHRGRPQRTDGRGSVRLHCGVPMGQGARGTPLVDAQLDPWLRPGEVPVPLNARGVEVLVTGGRFIAATSDASLRRLVGELVARGRVRRLTDAETMEVIRRARLLPALPAGTRRSALTTEDASGVTATLQVLVYIIWRWRLDCVPFTEAVVPPAHILAAYYAGLAPLGSLVNDGASRRLYRGLRLRAGGPHQHRIPDDLLDDVLIVLDVLIENAAVLRSFFWADDAEGTLAVGAAVADILTGVTASPTLGVINPGDALGVYWWAQNAVRFNADIWRLATRAGPRLVRAAPQHDEGDCAPYELRVLAQVLVHELTHVAFRREFGLQSDGCQCDGGDFQGSPLDVTRHYFCNWLASRFVDLIWPPQPGLVPLTGAGDAEQRHFNGMTMTQHIASACFEAAGTYTGPDPSPALGFFGNYSGGC